MQTLYQTIREVEKKKFALGHFNAANLEQLKAIVNVARRLNAPVIVGVSEGEREFMGVEQIVALIKTYKSEGLPIFLNADHTHSLEKVREAAMAGFDAIVFDASKLPLKENIAQTREAVKIAKAINKNIIVEGELGYIGSGSELRKELPKGAAIRPEDLTKSEEAARFVKETGVDMLAPAVGNIHGMFQNAPEPKLDIERIRAIKKAVKIPLVLHGGSGNTDEDFLSAIEAGISIIHISTELRVAWRKGLEEALKENPDEVAPYKLMNSSIQEMEKVIEKKMRLFNKLK
jgi:fructose-bisphosphate aldolase class II